MVQQAGCASGVQRVRLAFESMNAHKILIVEDNLAVQRAYQHKLEARGYTVLIAIDGSEAVHEMRRQRPDLLLVDLNLPDKDQFSPVQWDGFTVIEWMHRLHADHHVPFLVLTSSKDPRHRERAEKLGAAAFFHKSADFREVLDAIDKVFATAKPKPEAGAGGGTP